MAENDKNIPGWVQTLVSIVIGAIITVVTTWYAITKNKDDEHRAERERLSKVKDNITSIIEEHIVNKDTIDLISLERIKNIRCEEENVINTPSLYSLLSLAEYNIQNSKHLNFEKKKEYSQVIKCLFDKLVSDKTIEISKIQYPELTNEIIKFFTESQKLNGKQRLYTLIKKYENDITSKTQSGKVEKSVLDYISDNSITIVIVMSGYIVLTYLFARIIRRRRKKIEEYILMKRKFSEERELLQNKIADLMNELINVNYSEDKKEMIRKEIEYLINHLMKIDSNLS